VNHALSERSVRSGTSKSIQYTCIFLNNLQYLILASQSGDTTLCTTVVTLAIVYRRDEFFGLANRASFFSQCISFFETYFVQHWSRRIVLLRCFKPLLYATLYCQDTYFLHYTYVFHNMGRDSTVGIATGYRLDDPRGRSRSLSRGKNIRFSTSFRPTLGFTQPPIHWVSGALSPGVKRPGYEADNSPTGAKVKKLWIYTSTPPYAFMS
jgi:hypothetical protein